jgi:hypothetical protein
VKTSSRSTKVTETWNLGEDCRPRTRFKRTWSSEISLERDRAGDPKLKWTTESPGETATRSTSSQLSKF